MISCFSISIPEGVVLLPANNPCHYHRLSSNRIRIRWKDRDRSLGWTRTGMVGGCEAFPVEQIFRYSAAGFGKTPVSSGRRDHDAVEAPMRMNSCLISDLLRRSNPHRIWYRVSGFCKNSAVVRKLRRRFVCRMLGRRRC